jgi:hypothetical protein
LFSSFACFLSSRPANFVPPPLDSSGSWLCGVRKTKDSQVLSSVVWWFYPSCHPYFVCLILPHNS